MTELEHYVAKLNTMDWPIEMWYYYGNTKYSILIVPQTWSIERLEEFLFFHLIRIMRRHRYKAFYPFYNSIASSMQDNLYKWTGTRLVPIVFTPESVAIIMEHFTCP